MQAVDIIAKKRDGLPLSRDEIAWFVRAYVRDEIADYQAAAWLMAVYLNGMTREETVNLTLTMANSGDTLDLSDITDYAVDKHSSGGVGDKTTLVVLPLVAAFGVPVAKMSGRGLGFSGGTLDKLEAIPGMNVNLSPEAFRAQAKQHGFVLAGQTGDLTPADGKFYALRDVTATVSSLPLIASSIMSKKIAAGAGGIVLDVKTGNGAFMTTQQEATDLARIMVGIGEGSGRDVIAAISDMNQPLGQAVGNALETAEAIETMKGGGPVDFRQHCIKIAAYMLQLAGRGARWTDETKVATDLRAALDDGRALAKFRTLVEVQGGDPRVIDDPALMPQAAYTHTMTATRAGYIAEMPAGAIGMASVELGAGRAKKTDAIDHAVGLTVLAKIGDSVAEGQPLLTIHANTEAKIPAVVEALEAAITYSEARVEPPPLFYETIIGNRSSS